MQFDIITIFPKIFDSYFAEGVLARAKEKGLIKINTHDLRNYTKDKHRTVDDIPYGGGAGMVIKIEPVYKALLDIVGKENLKFFRKEKNKKLKSKVHSFQKTRVVLLSAKGKKFNQKTARKFSALKKIVLICGRYEGVDERIKKYLADDEISIGEFILTGGEIPALVIIDAVSRLIKGTLGNKESAMSESFSKNGYLEYPHYTRPAVFCPTEKFKWNVPKVLIGGNHEKIEKWRNDHSGKLK